MEVRDWILVASVVVAVASWFANGFLNRKHEIFKKRLDYRLDMYQSFTAMAMALERIMQEKEQEKAKMDLLTKAFIEGLEASHVKALIYGDEFEIEKINSIVEFAHKNEHAKMKDKMAELMNSTRQKFRSDIGLKKLRNGL